MLVFAALLACKKEDPEQARLETCAAYRASAHDLARKLRYSEVTPWEARGELNRIKDALARNRCDEAPTTREAVTHAPAAPKKPKASAASPATPKATRPGCEGLDPEVCDALAKPKSSPKPVEPIPVTLDETPP